MALSVGRRNSTVSTSGMSRPSLNRSAANRMLTRRALSEASARLARSSGSLRSRRAQGCRPREHTAMSSACATLTQKPRARIAPGSETFSRVLEHDSRTGVVAGVDVAELGLVVTTTRPGDGPQVGAVGDDEVVERAEQSCARASQSRSSAAVRPSKNDRTSMPSARSGVAVRPSSSTGRGGRGSAGTCAPQRGGTRRSRRRRRRRTGCWRRRTRSATGHWRTRAASARAGATDVQLAEVTVTEDLPVGAHRLLEDLAPVGDKEQTRPLVARAESAVVQCRDDGLAGARRGDDEIAVPIVDGPLACNRVEHLLLVREGPDFQAGERDGDSISRASARGVSASSSRSRSASGSYVSNQSCSSTCRTWPRTSAATQVLRPSRAGRSTRRRRAVRSWIGSTTRRTPCRNRVSTEQPRLRVQAGRAASYWTFTSAPNSRTSRSKASRSVPPM